MKSKFKGIYDIAVEQCKNIAVLLGLFISIIAINATTTSYLGKRESKAVEKQLELQWREDMTNMLKSVQDTITIFSNDFHSYQTQDIKWKENHEKKETLKEESLKEIIKMIPNNRELTHKLNDMERQFNLFTKGSSSPTSNAKKESIQMNPSDHINSCVPEIKN